jgi:hypothetical protein
MSRKVIHQNEGRKNKIGSPDFSFDQPKDTPFLLSSWSREWDVHNRHDLSGQLLDNIKFFHKLIGLRTARRNGPAAILEEARLWPFQRMRHAAGVEFLIRGLLRVSYQINR